MRECAETCVKHDVACPVEDCRLWIKYDEDLNCTDIAVAKHGKMTLREISERIGVSFVRIKQIEDGLKIKMKKRINNLNRINNCR
jgi:hypothetical protein|tara:strand:- start:2169 stop:2423 length:255 start_codon:yes stop_codon:yes gene_type:complete